MKYKVGDIVKIRSLSDMEQEFGLDQFDYINNPGLPFLKRMEKCCGKVVTIKEVDYKGNFNCYKIKEYECNWTDDMIDHSATRILSIIDRLEMLKELVSPNFEMIIDRRIKNLKSNKPEFNREVADFYNYVFHKIKAGKI